MTRKPRDPAPVPPALQAKMLASVAPMVLAQAIAEALGKGYAVQFIPGGDPHVWRDLCAQARELFRGTSGPSARPEWHEDLSRWLTTYDDVCKAYSLQPPAAAQTQPEAP